MSGRKLTTCLWFDRQAEEAAKFYCSVFRNSRITQTTYHGEAGPGEKGAVFVVAFEIDGQPFSALNGGPMFQFTEAISFQIPCETQEEVDHYWSKLTADGGQEGPCGWLKDKFGLSWQIVPVQFEKMLNDADHKRSDRVMGALLKMRKLDLATLQRAYEGR